jgi:hypothetical protein
MSDPEPILREPIPVIPRAVASQPRSAGSPLSMGASPRQPLPASQGNPNRITSPPAQVPAPGPATAPNRALAAPASADDSSSGMQKAMNAVKIAMPIVQRLLPLLDGSIGTAVSNLLAPRSHPQQAPKVNLAPLEEGLTELQVQHRSLCEQVVEQNTSLKRVEDQLQHVREATDRNTLEQQELLEDLKAFSGKVKIVAFVGLGLLAGGLVLETLMFFHLIELGQHLQRVLP